MIDFEKEYANSLARKGKYTYISGYKEKKVKVRHNKCGNIVELSIAGALKDTKKDVCQKCKPVNVNRYYVSRNRKNLTEIERYVSKEAKKLVEVMHADGYLFGLDLKDYVVLAVKNDTYALKKFDEEDLINTYIYMIKERYASHRIAICRTCNKVVKGYKWGSKENYNKRQCNDCIKKGE